MEHIHLIGIGGSGLSAIARLLKEMGYEVSGSDRAESPFLAELQSAGVTINLGHDPKNISNADFIVRSSAIPDDNVEVVAAQAVGIPVLKRSNLLGRLMIGKTGIAVAGTHGKTTTTAMLVWLLTKLGQEPSFIVGSVINNLGVNARAGKGKPFVIEADEYDHMFLGLKPAIEVVTNIEYDHPDCFPTPVDYQASFVEFLKLLPPDGVLVACADDAGARFLFSEARKTGRKAVAYGISGLKSLSSDDWVLAKNVKVNEFGGFSFETLVSHPSPTPSPAEGVLVTLQVPGSHNILNALAALAVINLLGLSLEIAAQVLGQFTGTGRRFEVRGEANGIVVIDDYAHHPTEIRATLAAARSRYAERRIWAVWQPHTFSRTKVLFDQFTHAFAEADEVIVTEIYSAREPIQDYSAAQVVQAMPHPSVQFIPDLQTVSKFLISHLRSSDVLLVLSAGNANLVSTQVLAAMQTNEVSHA